MAQGRYTSNNSSPLIGTSSASQSILSRQSSLTRPTKASESKSVRWGETAQSGTSHSRQPSIRQQVRSSSPLLPNAKLRHKALETPRPTESASQTHVSSRLRTMATSASMSGLSDAGGRSLSTKSAGLYLSTKSSSSRSLSSQISPRRAGLGARTISPVELQRSQRSNKVLNNEKNLSEPSGASFASSIRNVSGIPSPVKILPLSRTRPSPIPPVPPIPDRLDFLDGLGSHAHPRKEVIHDGVACASVARQRSATVGLAKSGTTRASRIDEKNSFTSPIKQAKKLPNPRSEHTSGQLQPLNLPPLKVHSLNSPTSRKVEDMSQRLRAVRLDTVRSGVETTPGLSSDAEIWRNTMKPPLSAATLSGNVANLPDQGDVEQARVETVHGSSTEDEKLDQGSNYTDPAVGFDRARDAGGFLNRLSMSRSSSRSKAKSRKQSTDTSFDPSLTGMDLTPERSKRRLSLSWIKGKMSPFGASSMSVPRIDSGIPPTIPKSFTSDSLASQASNHEVSLVESAVSATLIGTDTTDVSHRSMSLRAHSPPFNTRLTMAEVADEEMRRLIISKKGSGYLDKAQAQIGALEARAVAVQPVEARNVALLNGSTLNLYEKGEVVDYDGKVYFTGQRGLSKIGGRLDVANSINFGYDDDRGDYLINPGDHFGYRYEIVDLLGKGSFGQVLRCIDYKTGSLVAVKVIRNKKRFHAQALVEVNILQRLRSWDPEDRHHLIKYTDHFYFRHHLCIATDLLGINLYEFLKANDFRGCTLNVIRSFASQILSCLKLLKRQRVIHCDLKPENILLVNVWESKIKIIDFGSSCFEDQKVYTYIQSRFYRSPEVILGLSYGLPIDMWSMGCILAELLTGYPIFPGEDEQEQLGCIMELFGPPEKHLIEHSTRKKLFFDSLGKPRNVVSSKGKKRKPSTKTLSQAIKCQDEAFLDFLNRCLRWNPATRLTPEEALAHPFVTGEAMRSVESPVKVSRKFVSNHLTSLTPRPLPQVPHVPSAQTSRLRNNYTSYRSSSTSVPGKPPMLGSPTKARRVISNLPVPRERVIT